MTEREWFLAAWLTVQEQTKPKYWFGNGLWFGTTLAGLGH